MIDFREDFSVIMPCYNAASTIEASIMSVTCQSYPHWRLYVIDDCSTDSTQEIIQAIAESEPRIIYLRQPQNEGVAVARNVGIRAAQGIFIAFLDSDDLWTEHKLCYQLEALESGYDVVCGNYNTFASSISEPLATRTFPKYFKYHDMLCSNKVGNLTGVYNQKKIGKVYQEKIGHEDYAMWLNIIKKAQCVYCCQECLAYYRVSSHSLSGNKIKTSLWQWKIYRQHLGMGRIASMYFWLRYAHSAILRK